MNKIEVTYPQGGYVDNALRIGHSMLFQTYLFGKEYFWMQDQDGTIYLSPPSDI